MQQNFIILICAMGTLSINAQSDTISGVQLQEVIFSASRHEKNVIDVGRSVTVITRDQLANSTAGNIADVLVQEEGIYIVGQGQNPGSVQTLFMRGSNNNQTVVMIDGIRITDPSSVDNSIDLSELSLAQVEQIEIVRGSHSTLYGSSAIGGVINIITTKNQKPGLSVITNAEGGVFGKGTSYLGEHVSVAYNHVSGFYVNAELINTDFKGLDATEDTITMPGVFKNIDNDDFSKLDWSGKAGYTNGDFKTFGGIRKIAKTAYVDDGAYVDDDNYVVDFDRTLYTYGAFYKINKVASINLSGGFTELARKAIDDSSHVDATGMTDQSYLEGNYSGTVFNNEVQVNLQGKGFDFVVGGGSYQETMSANTKYINTAWVINTETNLDTLNIESRTYAAFIHGNLNGSTISDELSKFSIAFGGRWNQHSSYGTNTTFDINPSIKVTSTSLLYGSYSTGFNAPALYRLFTPEQGFTGITRGNQNLNPESSMSYEFGFKQRFGNGNQIKINYFNTVTDNMIDYVYLWNGAQEIDSLGFLDYMGDTYLNIGQLTTKGVEVAVYSQLNKKLSIAGNISLLSGELKYNPARIDTAQTQGNHVQVYTNGAFLTEEVKTTGLSRRPQVANIQLNYRPVGKLHLSLDLRHVGARTDIYYDSNLGPFGALGSVPISDYTLINLGAKYLITKSLSALMKIENIFDVQYREINGYQTRGRGVFVQINYTFNSMN